MVVTVSVTGMMEDGGVAMGTVLAQQAAATTRCPEAISSSSRDRRRRHSCRSRQLLLGCPLGWEIAR